MLNYQRISDFISNKRKQLDMTQADVAEKLIFLSKLFQNGKTGTLPNVEILAELAESFEHDG